ncbi:hypothetical protein HXX76_011541 [Chlamydomonas incerta]|uniref:Armadillo-like repeats domain-containing protein n=1 Tax=Chlamydomonas incerta TaxID=51695 RepID=A0A835SYV5_CHLIN|nr:hypothetical protein HXX76_011541 [Chlamydomonas incerta]|eukprot:KAG2428421.1 hypothetical protein HXX76_011541 [Chlamydomonas incerta]
MINSQTQRALAARGSASQQATRVGAVLIPVRGAGPAAPVLPPRAPCPGPTNAPRRWSHTPAALPNRRQMRQQVLESETEEEETEESEALAAVKTAATKQREAKAELEAAISEGSEKTAAAAPAAAAAAAGAAAKGGESAAAVAPAAAVAETVAVAPAAKKVKTVVVTEVEEMEVEQIIEPLTFQSAARNTQAFLTTTLPGKLVLGALGAALLGSIGLAVARAYEKANTARAKRMRQIDRNRELVDGLNKYLLAGNRAGLTPGELRRLQRASGFTAVEVFRKYLWYLLRERKFDQGAVEDLVALKTGLGLSDADAGEALRERSARVYDKYGSLMLNTEGLTLAGAQRKATCMALFRKVLFLAEYDRLVGRGAEAEGGAGNVADIGKIFGATREDMDRLRIKNLYEAELDLEGMVLDTADEADEAPGGTTAGGQQQQQEGGKAAPGGGGAGAGEPKKQ